MVDIVIPYTAYLIIEDERRRLCAGGEECGIDGIGLGGEWDGHAMRHFFNNHNCFLAITPHRAISFP